MANHNAQLEKATNLLQTIKETKYCSDPMAGVFKIPDTEVYVRLSIPKGADRQRIFLEQVDEDGRHVIWMAYLADRRGDGVGMHMCSGIPSNIGLERDEEEDHMEVHTE